MTQCASWNPVVRPGVPYEPEPYEPMPQDVLDLMTPRKYNKERTKAKNWWFYFMRRKWRAAMHNLPKGSDRDGKIDELQKVYRDGRAEIFGTERHSCGYSGRKFWRTDISYVKSWEASKPDWYTFD